MHRLCSGCVISVCGTVYNYLYGLVRKFSAQQYFYEPVYMIKYGMVYSTAQKAENWLFLAS
jgi:hypothetical protein